MAAWLPVFDFLRTSLPRWTIVTLAMKGCGNTRIAKLVAMLVTYDALQAPAQLNFHVHLPKQPEVLQEVERQPQRSITVVVLAIASTVCVVAVFVLLINVKHTSARPLLLAQRATDLTPAQVTICIHYLAQGGTMAKLASEIGWETAQLRIALMKSTENLVPFKHLQDAGSNWSLPGVPASSS